MKLSALDIKTMVNECLSILLEATTESVYAKYYSSSIPRDVWDTLTKGTTNMTPFHRKIADLIVSCAKCKNNPSYEDRDWDEFVQQVALYAAMAWNSGDHARQFLLQTANKNYYYYNLNGDADGIISFLDSVIGMGKASEDEFSTNGLVKLYEDDILLVTVTLSYTASHTYYHDSHWCTASGIDGRYNGFEMFCSYCSPDEGGDALLVQFVDKRNREQSYQIAYDGTVTHAHDFEDTAVTMRDITSHFGEAVINQVLEKLRAERKKLNDEKLAFMKSERNYYQYKNFSFLTSNGPKLSALLDTPDVREKMVSELTAELSPYIGRMSLMNSLNRVYTDSFDFSLLGLFYDTKDNDNTYHIAVRASIRTNYINGDPASQREKEKSIFSEDERSIMSRLGRNSWASNIWNNSFRTLLFKVHFRQGLELVKILKGKPNTMYGYIAPMRVDDRVDYTDMRDGKVLFSTKRTNYDTSLIRQIRRYDGKYYFGIPIEYNSDYITYKVMFLLYTKDVKLEKTDFNMTYSFETADFVSQV